MKQSRPERRYRLKIVVNLFANRYLTGFSAQICRCVVCNPSCGSDRESPQMDREVIADQFEQQLVKTGDRLIKHARDSQLLLAESRLPRHLFGSVVRRIAVLPSPGG